MSDRDGYWTLGVQINRKIQDKIYTSLRLYVPNNDDTKPLLKMLQDEGGEYAKLHFRAKIHGSRIILTQVQREVGTSATSPSLDERADHIITMVAQLGGTTTWPAVRERLGLPVESMPGPFLVKKLKDRGLLTIKNPKTSTMVWKLIDRERLNGWTGQ
jgi:hypothetical protein